jgi:hypothetical protein
MSQEDEKPPPEFFSLEKHGSTANSGARRLIEVAGMLILQADVLDRDGQCSLPAASAPSCSRPIVTRSLGALLLLTAQ